MNRGENVLSRQVLDTHFPDDTDVDVKPLVHTVEEILWHATVNGDHAGAHTDFRKFHQTKSILMLNSMSHVIHKLAYEMSSKCLTGVDGHTTTLSLLHTVGNFQWDAKVALILASFAMNYAEFWVPHKIFSRVIDAVNKLITSVLDLTRCIIQFKKLPSMYISSEVPAMVRASNTFPIAAYWNVRGVISCAVSLTSMGDNSEMMFWELSSIVHKINQPHEFLRKQLEECERVIGERKEVYFKNLINELLAKDQVDNMEILKTLLNTRDDPLPLFDGFTRKMVSLDVLRKRYVLLLISGLDSSHDELLILEQIYMEMCTQHSRESAMYDLVWVPIVDPIYTEGIHVQFEEMRKYMPWYSVNHPLNIDQAVKKCIERRWHFGNKLIVVVLDPQGKELNPNAINMLWFWGNIAFPYTKAREDALWRDETWRLELLVNGIDPTVLYWVMEDKYIILFGGDDIEWIRNFTRNARVMASASGIPLEMVYVGKSKKIESLRRAIFAISTEKLSYCWEDTTLIWFFWARLESMLSYKTQSKHSNKQDLIMMQIKKLLKYDQDGSWALLCKGSQILTNGNGSTMLQTVADFNLWKEDIPSRGFYLPFKDYHDKLAANICCQFELPITACAIFEGMQCPKCPHFIDKYIAFLCTHDKPGLL